jgi:hypothetical protein
MRMLRGLLTIHLAAFMVGAVVTLLFVWFNNYPSELGAWYSGVVEWQGCFWSCIGYVWFVLLCAVVNISGGSAGDPCTVEPDSFSAFESTSAFGVHPTSGNITYSGIDCDGNFSGNFQDPLA